MLHLFGSLAMLASVLSIVSCQTNDIVLCMSLKLDSMMRSGVEADVARRFLDSLRGWDARGYALAKSTKGDTMIVDAVLFDSTGRRGCLVLLTAQGAHVNNDAIDFWAFEKINKECRFYYTTGLPGLFIPRPDSIRTASQILSYLSQFWRRDVVRLGYCDRTRCLPSDDFISKVFVPDLERLQEYFRTGHN